MSKKFYVFILASLIIVLAASFLSKSQNTKITSEAPSSPVPSASDEDGVTREQYTVTVSVDFGNGKTEKADIFLNKPSTAYDALLVLVQTKNLSINTKQYDFGVFVESINGFESNKDKAWIYYVNGKSGSVAADKQEVMKKDLIEWKYTVPAAE